MDGFGDSQIMNTLVRMVVPMRREFGRSLDVQHFLRDATYADAVIAEALTSQDPRLRDYAIYVKSRLAGARGGVPPPAGAPPAGAPAAEVDAKAEALRAQVLKKYTGGLR